MATKQLGGGTEPHTRAVPEGQRPARLSSCWDADSSHTEVHLHQGPGSAPRAPWQYVSLSSGGAKGHPERPLGVIPPESP